MATNDGTRADTIAAIAAAILIALSATVGAILNATGQPVHITTPPIFATVSPHVSWSTPVALAIAAATVWYGPAVARTLPWRRLLLAGWATSVAWILALAMVDGWSRFANLFAKPSEYLSDVPNAPPWNDFLPTFAGRIVDGQPDSWAIHVAGHPPGAFAFFVFLDRIGLHGPAAAAIVVVLLGATGCVAVAIAIRALDSEAMARRAMPFLVLAPTAIWMGVSADAMFLAVTAWGVALLCLRSTFAAIAGGLLLGASLYLSYGFVLLAIPALAVLVARRSLRAALLASAGAAAVVLAVTVGGFAWWEGYEQLVIRYNQGVGGLRPDGYWIWANFGALALATGPAVAAGLRRTRVRRGIVVPVLAALACVVVASLSGMSKSEVERIWLPFAAWLLASCALLPAAKHRRWLAVQAGAALLLQHLLITQW
ncbi:hypothetical protein [Tenggerimyces flavus]|uniref:Integral membrane protein n=1 Tax=Tenggerimyces flavus TaxID=1708749 RepID=A0ABV7YN04_9ACTN|nr:hypothetical protein [Tenggerimyces flavus]MBM7785786.1 hypothetical protein [Tenggerimyces flavus]